MRAIVHKASRIIKNAVASFLPERNGILRYGEDNKLPLQIIEKVKASGTAKSCVDVLSKFIFADGLVDEALAQTKANGKQTFDLLINSLIPNLVYFEAVCYRVLYSRDGTPSKFFNLPISEIRRTVNGDGIIWNKKFGQRDFKPTENKWMQFYDPNETPQARMDRILRQVQKFGKQVGDVVLIFNEDPGPYGDVYPVPKYYSGIEDIESDAALQRLENRNITRGFKTPIIISTGPVDNVIQDENGKTEKNKFDEVVKTFAGDDAAIAMHLEGATPELKPTVTTIPIAEILDQTDKSRDRVGRAVCRHFNVAPILVGFSTPGQLGNMQELENTIELMQMFVIRYQVMISEALKLVMPDKNWTMSTLEIFTAQSDEGMDGETKKAQAALRGSVGGVQGIVSIFANATMPRDAAMGLLMEVYGFDAVQAANILGSYSPGNTPPSNPPQP